MKRVVNAKWLLALSVLSAGLGLTLAGTLVATAQTTPAAPTGPAASAPAAADKKAQAIARFQAAKALHDAEKYKEAAAENDAALALDPNLAEALLLKRILASKLSGQSAETEPATAPTAGKVRLLTREQVSLIRVFELSEADTKVRGSVDRKILEEFWNDYMKKELQGNITRQDFERFVSPNNFANQVAKIKESKTLKYIEAIKLDSDPAFYTQFRNKIQPFVLQNCATAACHGGGNAGDFILTGRAGLALTPEQSYTNFYIMSHYTAKNGSPFINRDDPIKSLLIQYAMPKNVSQHPHPGDVEIRRFADENSEEAKNLVAWVKTLAFPRPNYGITYEMPKAATQPASQSAPQTSPK